MLAIGVNMRMIDSWTLMTMILNPRGEEPPLFTSVPPEAIEAIHELAATHEPPLSLTQDEAHVIAVGTLENGATTAERELLYEIAMSRNRADSPEVARRRELLSFIKVCQVVHEAFVVAPIDQAHAPDRLKKIAQLEAGMGSTALAASA